MKPFWKGENLHSYFCSFHRGGRERKRQREIESRERKGERNEKERATESEKDSMRNKIKPERYQKLI